MAHKGATTMPAPARGMMDVEVTVVSGESVRLGSGRALGRGAYAVVHTAAASARTHVDDDDADCNGYPYWAEAVRVALPAGAGAALAVEICRGLPGGRVESVAEARVPVEDFTVGPPGYLHCLSYRLFSAGRGQRVRNGIVNITVKRLDGVAPAGRKAPPPAAGKKAVDSGPGASAGSCCGVSAADQVVKPAAAGAPTGAVMGYPVGFSATGHADSKGCA